jgi:oligopeptide/dipeptide ABC transporter ATP-binding protein
MIAMALSCQPRLLIADEPTTALDVTIQAQILELLRKLQKERGMAMLLITHDLGVVAENADTVAVMYASRVVEFGTVEDIFEKPQHPYTRGLLRSVPVLGAKEGRLESIPGMVPNPTRFPPGCKFHTRCPRTREAAAGAPADQTVEVMADDERFRVLKVCQSIEPALREVQPKHWGACHLIEGFDRSPVTLPVLDHRRAVSAATIGTEQEGSVVEKELGATKV